MSSVRANGRRCRRYGTGPTSQGYYGVVLVTVAMFLRDRAHLDDFWRSGAEPTIDLGRPEEECASGVRNRPLWRNSHMNRSRFHDSGVNFVANSITLPLSPSHGRTWNHRLFGLSQDRSVGASGTCVLDTIGYLSVPTTR